MNESENRNRLAQETSPYLLEHKHNYVNWWPWCDEALDLAKQQNKPILLSVGYSACHWCHVMARESFEDKETARLMNNWFINIKVDREERPDIDHTYMQAVNLMGQHGGWPLTMFLFPNGQPFYGGTYFPKERRYGLPGFKDVLNHIRQAWEENNRGLSDIATTVTNALNADISRKPGLAQAANISLKDIDMSAEKLMGISDLEYGGIKKAPKFPQTLMWQYLWRVGMRKNRDDMKQVVKNTAFHLCEGGIYDHLGGGWARYSTDSKWFAPHFEKMLYDNALIISLLIEVWQESKNKLYEARIEETVKWLKREMLSVPDSQGNRAFISSQNAESEGVEGKFYVWKAKEIDEILGEDSAIFKKAYGIKEDGNWEEGTNILYRNHQNHDISIPTELLISCKTKLFKTREKRIRPSSDDKVLADWNGLMIYSLTKAALVFDKKEWLALAVSAFAFIKDNMQSSDMMLGHSYCKGKLMNIAFLADYTNLCLAALELYSATGDRAYLDQSVTWVKTIKELFYDEESKAYFDTTAQKDLISRTKIIEDSVTPSGNGILTIVLAKLYYLLGEGKFHDEARDLISALYSTDIEAFSISSLLSGAALLEHAIHIKITGDAGSAYPLVLEAARIPNANIIIEQIRNIESNEVSPLAYICTKGKCLPPVKTPLQLVNAVKG
ncbi:thioredoxin domain-containing protein [Candidatus Jidaibacter acanthamoebae]|nr:thioredoxin domain-containing protein [Candidatus Jidaibacter acanthamoeba]